jgi:hypothetical protein
VSLEQLIQHGLFDILPELEDDAHWAGWAERVIDLRNVLLFSKPAPTSKTEIRKLITISYSCFGNGFARIAPETNFATQPARVLVQSEVQHDTAPASLTLAVG